MHISTMKESKFLTKHDVEPPIRVTITGLSHEDMAQEGKPPELKYALHFQEVKPMVLNATNIQLVAMATGSEETEDWKGKQIVLYNDPSISFGGQLTGGIRVQIQPQAAQQQQPAQQAVQQPQPGSQPINTAAGKDFNDDIPW